MMQVSSAAKRSVSASLGKMLLLAGGLIGAAIAVKLLPGTGGLQSLPTAHLSVAGLVALGAIACAVGVPRQVVAFVAGYGWGLLPGIALALAAQLVGCAANLFWARAVGRDFVRRRLGTRLARINTILARRPFAADACNPAFTRRQQSGAQPAGWSFPAYLLRRSWQHPQSAICRRP